MFEPCIIEMIRSITATIAPIIPKIIPAIAIPFLALFFLIVIIDVMIARRPTIKPTTAKADAVCELFNNVSVVCLPGYWSSVNDIDVKIIDATFTINVTGRPRISEKAPVFVLF